MQQIKDKGTSNEKEEKTEYINTFPKTIINKVNSPDLGMNYSLNPYQGCEHGCLYCYARNTHEYYGFSAGLDFERKIIVKRNAPELLEALKKAQETIWYANYSLALKSGANSNQAKDNADSNPNNLAIELLIKKATE